MSNVISKIFCLCVWDVVNGTIASNKPAPSALFLQRIRRLVGEVETKFRTKLLSGVFVNSILQELIRRRSCNVLLKPDKAPDTIDDSTTYCQTSGSAVGRLLNVITG
jgi:hypothetical protein